MKKHIFHSICFATIAIFLVSFVLIMGVLYSYFSSLQIKGLKTETYIAASAVEMNGINYLKKISDGDYRITWISFNGKVLFDNVADSSEMENHLEREEINEALKTGYGQSVRYSTTLTEKQLYCAKKLSDGSVLRLSSTQYSWWVLILSMSHPIVLIIITAVVLSVFMAYRLAKRIVKPLNELDLEKPDTEETYEELSPLLNRISKQKKLLYAQKNELKRKEEEFDATTENMREGIILLSKNGKILSINKAASRILKIGRQCIGKDLLSVNDTFEVQELLRISANAEPAEINFSVDNKEYQVNASPIITENSISGIAVIIFDITEKEIAETARREFTANVSHELKTLLQSISGYAELLVNGMVRSEDLQDFYSNIYIETKRLIALINDIIKLSHLDENICTYEFERTDLYELAIITHRNLLPAAQKKDIEFNIIGKSTEINGISSLLSEIIYNLCDNAIKYTPIGGKVILYIKNYTDSVVLSVEDNGIGISAEEQEHIFERFYRVDKSRSKEVGGTGLGLSIVKHASIVHGAELKVKSKVGEGSIFSIIFPNKKF